MSRTVSFQPLLFGGDINVYSVARAFHEAYGVKSVAFGKFHTFPCAFSSIIDYRTCPDNEDPAVFLSNVEKVALEFSHKTVIVLGCGDSYVQLCAHLKDQFPRNVVAPYIDGALLDRLINKEHFYELCDQHGIDHPATFIYDKSMGHDFSLPWGAPYIAKPADSVAYWACGDHSLAKVYICQSWEELLESLDHVYAAGYQDHMVLQEFIPGGDDAMRVLNSYSDTDGTVRAMCLGQPVLEYYDPKSVGNYAAILSRGDTLLYDKMQRFLQAIGYVGFSNIDMKYDSRTGRYVLFEINPRLGRSSFFCRAAGINMMKLLTEDVVYGRRGKCIYNETTALWSNVPRGILTRYVTSPALREEMKQYKALHTLWCGGDLAPARVYRLARYYAAQYKNFAHYYFDKSKEK